MTHPATSGGSPVPVSTTAPRATWLLCTAICGVGLALGGCASQDRVAQGAPSVDRFNSRYGVSSSPRVVEEGRPVPRGGGVYRVGRPYTVAGRRYTPFEKREGHTETGIASWYGRQFHGRLTANGEVYNMHTLSAAHRTMPMPSYARVTNMANGHSLVVRVNDRGPFHGNRVIDLSQRASNLLNFRGQGLARVKVEYIGRASLEGSDDRILLATLRTDGRPAPRPNQVTSTMMASAAPQTVPDPAPRQAEPAVATVATQPVLASASQGPAPAPSFGFFRQDTPSADLRQPDPAPVIQTTAQPQVAASPITLASAPLPMARPDARGSAPLATTVVARNAGPAQAASTVTVVATPAP
ncbi:MAG: rare lipoprotein A, partial [Xanthobacteraceae bacterium]